jgi:hypothetical protein
MTTRVIAGELEPVPLQLRGTEIVVVIVGSDMF